jgi:hypothetical protein
LSVWAQFYAPLNFFSSNFCVLRVHIFFFFSFWVVVVVVSLSPCSVCGRCGLR